jgi:hypothetical protein
MMRRIASFLLAWFWPAVAAAQVAGAGYVDPLSICQGYTYTYNLVTGSCTTNSPKGCASGGGTTASLATTLVTGTGNETNNNAAFLLFAKNAQWHTRPAGGGYAGGYSGAFNNTTGDGNQATDASGNNCIAAYIPAGNPYVYNNNQWIGNIPWLKVYGDGGLTGETALENTCYSSACGVTYSGGADQVSIHNIDWFTTFDIAAPNNMGYFIQSIPAGATSATLSGSPANASDYCAGCWIIIGSYDQQFGGYPANWRYFDMARVTSANSSTGVITWDIPTHFAHVGLPSGFTSSSITNPWCIGSGSYIDGNYCYSTLTDGPTGNWGPARIVPIDTPSHPVQKWLEIDHIKFNGNPNWNGGNGPQNIQDCVALGGQIDVSLTDLWEVNGICMADVRNLAIVASQWQGMESDKNISTLFLWNDSVTYQDWSHPNQLLYFILGSHISAAGGTGNTMTDSTLLAANSIFDALVQNCNSYVSSIGLQPSAGSRDNTVSLINDIFVGSGQSCQANNGPINATSVNTSLGAGGVTVGATAEPVVQVATGPNGANTRLQASVVGGGTIPGGSNTYGGLTGYGSGAYEVAQNCYIGDFVFKNGALVNGATVTNVTTDGTNVYIDVSGTTWANSNTFQCGQFASVSETNVQGVLTGYTWGSGGNFGMRYPSGTSIPSVTATNGKGN